MTQQKLSARSRDLRIGKVTLAKNGMVVDGDLSPEEWEDVGEYLSRCDGAIRWWIGDWYNAAKEGEAWRGRRERAAAKFGIPEATIDQFARVSRAFKLCNRLQSLSWTHHFVVAAETDRKNLLACADESRLSVSQLKRLVRERDIANPPLLPQGVYRVIYADPPWQYGDSREGLTGHTGSGASSHYKTMPTQEICDLTDPNGKAISELAATDSVLFMWATAPFLPDALQVLTAWGFAYKTHYIWDKVRPYVGNYSSVRHELLLVATRGSCLPDSTERPASVIEIEKSKKHSQKPHEFYGLIESLYFNGPYLELFARNTRALWDSWGNQVDCEN